MPVKEDEPRPIIVEEIKKDGDVHHGGAWKVAYADFVTAMMAFFLLMWLLNVTTKEQRQGIANYFNPNQRVSKSFYGSGGILGGLSIAKEGQLTTNIQPVNIENPPEQPALRPGSNKTPDANITDEEKNTGNDKPKENKLGKDDKKSAEDKEKEAQKKKEEESFLDIKKKLDAALQKDPQLAELAKQLLIEVTPEGLRIQLLDQDDSPMFPSGSDKMYDKAKMLLKEVSKAITDIPNKVSVRGHTDSVPYGSKANYTNWELSADRANASRRVLLDSGLPSTRLHDVIGKADKDHLFPEDPRASKNRRISIVLLRQELTEQEFEKAAEPLITIIDKEAAKKEQEEREKNKQKREEERKTQEEKQKIIEGKYIYNNETQQDALPDAEIVPGFDSIGQPPVTEPRIQKLQTTPTQEPSIETKSDSLDDIKTLMDDPSLHEFPGFEDE